MGLLKSEALSTVTTLKVVFLDARLHCSWSMLNLGLAREGAFPCCSSLGFIKGTLSAHSIFPSIIFELKKIDFVSRFTAIEVSIERTIWVLFDLSNLTLIERLAWK